MMILLKVLNFVTILLAAATRNVDAAQQPMVLIPSKIWAIVTVTAHVVITTNKYP